MELTSLKYWHWGVIGLAIGSIVGLSWMNMPSEVARSADVNDFKRNVGALSTGARFPGNKDLPIIKNIVVMPPETDPDGKLIYPVTYDRLGVNAKDQTVYQEQGLYAKTPFDGDQSITAYLDGRDITFSDRTGPGKYRPVGMGAGIGILTIGFIWPTFIRFLVGAGFEKPRPREPKKVYATGELEDGTIKDKKKGVNAKDHEQLGALNDRLESIVGQGLKSRAPGADAKEVDEIVSKLMSGTGSRNAPDPTAVVPVAAPEEPKEYQGEWYPVVKPKHHDEKK